MTNRLAMLHDELRRHSIRPEERPRAEARGAALARGRVGCGPTSSRQRYSRQRSNEDLTVSDALVSFVAAREGFRGELYNDPSGHCTVGYGHLVHRNNCNGDASETPFLAGLTEARATELMREDLEAASRHVRRLVTRELTQHQFDALTSFVFAVGGGHFRDSTLLRVINAGEMNQVRDAFMMWVKARNRSGELITLPGLEERRRQEADMFESGQYPTAQALSASSEEGVVPDRATVWDELGLSSRSAGMGKSIAKGRPYGRTAVAMDDPPTSLAYGVANAQITDPFYRNREEKRAVGSTNSRSRHLGIDVSTSRDVGGGANDPRRGLAVYATMRATIPVAELNAARAASDENGTPQTLSLDGSGNATLVDAYVKHQPWALPNDAYGGVLRLACRYRYTRTSGLEQEITLCLEYLHLITREFLPKDGQGNLISAEEWAATGKGIDFGPQMRDETVLTAAELTGGSPLLVGYLGATEFPHVHIQVAYREGRHDSLRRYPRVDPTVMVR